MKKNLAFGLAISILCLYLVLRHIDLKSLQQSLATVRYSYLVGAFLCVLIFTFFRALRWKYMLQPLKEISTYSLFQVVMIGYLANNILPARIGEVVRAVVLGKTEGINKITAFTTIIMERIFDVITLVLILILTSRFSPLGKKNDHILFLLIVGFIILSVFLLLVKYEKNWFLKIINRILKPISPAMTDKVTKGVEAFFAGLEVLAKGGHLPAISILSLLIGFSLAGIYYFVAVSFGIKLTLPGLLFLLSVIFLGILIPSSPGFIGTFHYFCMKGLLALGVHNKNLAFSYALVAHLIQYIPESVLGTFFFWKKGLSFREIQTAEIQTEQGVE